MFDEKFDPVKAILVGVQSGDIREVSLDISSRTSQVSQYLGGRGTFIGQWPEHDIVIMKCVDTIFDPGLNSNRLAKPFQNETVVGPMLLIRMDEKAEPKDLFLSEVQASKLVLPKQLRRSARLQTCVSSEN